MKKLITSLLVLFVGTTSAQNLINYGMLGNPTHLISNPAADPMTRFHLGYAQVYQDVNLGLTAGDLFGGPDGILGNLSALETDMFSITNETHVDALSLGLKLGKNYLFAGTQLDLWVRGDVDLDLVRFAYSGMADDQGNFDPNYVGDFSDFGLAQDLMGTWYVGYQRTLFDKKLRIGGTFNQVRYYGGFRLNVNELTVSNSVQANGLPEIDAVYDLELQTSNILSDGNITTLDTLGNFVKYLDQSYQLDPQALLNSPMATANTFNLGVTARPFKRLEMSFNYNGIGASVLESVGDRTHSVTQQKTISGFSYTSSPGDTLANEIGSAADVFIEDLQNLSLDLQERNTSYDVQLPQTLQGSVNFYLGKRSYVGAHYVQRQNSLRDYTYLGFNGLWWIGKSLQLKGGYYLGQDDMSADFANLALQFRITPFAQVFIGTRSVMDIATVADAYMNDPAFELMRPVLPADFSTVHINAGASMVFYDKRFREERLERKEARAERKAQEAQSIAPPPAPSVPEPPAETSGGGRP